MSVDFHELLSHIRTVEFELYLISKGNKDALSYAGTRARDLRKLLEKAGWTPMERKATREEMGAAKKAKKLTPLPERKEPTYWDSVKSMAEDVKENCPDPNDNECRSTYIHQSVDGSAWIIYFGENETVLRETNNEPDASEVKAMNGDNADWKGMRQVAAYLAMEGDVWEAVRELDEKEPEE